ncbi:MAG TPA: hypothetical protein DEZ08_01980 [Dehalococcoidia bacterium]|jgi:alcohol dehydrogenase class IV|nr:hypothetical protein [Dehalococcoidia bacterium]
MDLRYVGYPVRIHAGDNSLSRINTELNRLKAKRVMIVCGNSIATKTNLIQRIKAIVDPSTRIVAVFDEAEASSPLPSIVKGVQMAKGLNIDCIISVGGGSSIVTTRGIIILLAENKSAFELCTQYPLNSPPLSPRLNAPKIPSISVVTTPTTATNRGGTALMDPETRTRLELFDPKTRPEAVIWDSEALLTATSELIISASSSLLTGVLAGLMTKSVLNPLSFNDLHGALKLLLVNLPLVLTDSHSADPRLNLCAASFLYNRACDGGVGGSSLGIVSAISHSIDTRFPQCSHGAAYSIITAPGIKFNAVANKSGMKRVFDTLIDFGALTPKVNSTLEISDWITGLFNDINMPVKLNEVGITRDDIETIATDSMEDFPIHSNVRKVTNPSEIVDLLSSVL